jgi:hypothetical protein
MEQKTAIIRLQWAERRGRQTANRGFESEHVGVVFLRLRASQAVTWCGRSRKSSGKLEKRHAVGCSAHWLFESYAMACFARIRGPTGHILAAHSESPPTLCAA